MNAKELRIGNLFENLTVKTITETGVNFSFKHHHYLETSFEDLKPIDMTIEWIEKLGFKKTKWKGYNKDFNLAPDFLFDGWVKDRIWCFIQYDHLNPVLKHKIIYFGRRVLSPILKDTWSFSEREGSMYKVHNFQNLYFALTGYDLTVT